MSGEYWYKYIKEHKPDVLGKDIIEYVEQLKLDKEELQKQLDLHVVSQQSELLKLKSFADWLQGEVWDDKHDDFSDYVEDYIKTL